MVAFAGIALRSKRSRPLRSALLFGRTKKLISPPKFVFGCPWLIKELSEGNDPLTRAGSAHIGDPAVGELVEVGVRVGVTVLVGVLVGVAVDVGVFVFVEVAVGVGVDV